MIIIDAHVHLWETQAGIVDGRPVRSLSNGLSDFGGETRQMMPPYITDNKNTVDRLIANMNYARVNGCVVTQEYIDGNQNEYLLKAKAEYPDRIRICALYEDEGFRKARRAMQNTPAIASDCSSDKGSEELLYSAGLTDSDSEMAPCSACLADSDSEMAPCSTPLTDTNFDGLKICASRLANPDLKVLLPVFKAVERAGKFISIDMADGAQQVTDMQYLINECPDLRIAIGHFGMVTTKGWQEQIKLAKNKNVYIESGGLTWLFHKEFYPYPSAVDAINEAKELVGIEKLMWGSDYPRTMTDITYIMATRFILETPKLTIKEKEAFLGKNAERFYGFTGLTEMPEIGNML